MEHESHFQDSKTAYLFAALQEDINPSLHTKFNNFLYTNAP